MRFQMPYQLETLQSTRSGDYLCVYNSDDLQQLVENILREEFGDTTITAPQFTNYLLDMFKLASISEIPLNGKMKWVIRRL